MTGFAFIFKFVFVLFLLFLFLLHFKVTLTVELTSDGRKARVGRQELGEQ